MKWRVLAVFVVALLSATAFTPKQYRALAWQYISEPVAQAPAPVEHPIATTSDWALQLIQAAESQIGVTVRYDGAYASLDFPMGDVPIERGVCTDVLIRALRDAHGIDLQALVNTDMKAAFGQYPTRWGLSRPDSNIDHRRVLNLEIYFERLGASLLVSEMADDYIPGDIVTWRLPGNLPHIGIITNRTNRNGTIPLVVHNVGAGTRLEDMLFKYEITGHYRLEGVGW